MGCGLGRRTVAERELHVADGAGEDARRIVVPHVLREAAHGHRPVVLGRGEAEARVEQRRQSRVVGHLSIMG